MEMFFARYLFLTRKTGMAHCRLWGVSWAESPEWSQIISRTSEDGTVKQRWLLVI